MNSVITDERKNIIANLANNVSSDECRFGSLCFHQRETQINQQFKMVV